MGTNSLNKEEREHGQRYYGANFETWPESTRTNFINLGPRGAAGSEVYNADVAFINKLKGVNAKKEGIAEELMGPFNETMKYYKEMAKSMEAYSKVRMAREKETYQPIYDETMATLNQLPKDSSNYRQALEKLLKFSRIQNKKKAILAWREQAKGLGKAVRSGPAQQQQGNIVNAAIGADRQAGVQTEIEAQRWTDERQKGLMDMLRSLMAGSDPTGAQSLNLNAIGGMGTAAQGMTQIQEYLAGNDFKLQLMQMQQEADRKANKFKIEDLIPVAAEIFGSQYLAKKMAPKPEALLMNERGMPTTNFQTRQIG